MLNFIKFLADGTVLRVHKGLIWSHNPFLFDYQLLIVALNWSLLNMAASEVGLSDVTGRVTGLRWRWQMEPILEASRPAVSTAGSENTTIDQLPVVIR